MGGQIIAVDFDGTLCRDCYPRIGEANEGLIRRLKERRAQGDRLILWTCRSGKTLEEALDFWAIAEHLEKYAKVFKISEDLISSEVTLIMAC